MKYPTTSAVDDFSAVSVGQMMETLLYRDSHGVQRLPHVCLFIHDEGCHWYYQFALLVPESYHLKRKGSSSNHCIFWLLQLNLKESVENAVVFSVYLFSIVLIVHWKIPGKYNVLTTSYHPRVH